MALVVTKRKSAEDRAFLRKLGKKVASIIRDGGYKSLDAFATAHHDQIAKPTLYEICDGKRDMKLTTLRALARALDVEVVDLLKES